MAFARVIEDSYDADVQLHRLGLERGWLVDADERGTIAFAFAPPYGMPGAPNYIAANQALSALQEVSNGMLMRGTHRGIPVVFTNDGSVAISVTTGDSMCGINGDQDPAVTPLKGPMTSQAIKPRLRFNDDSDDTGVEFYYLLSRWASPSLFEISRPKIPLIEGRIEEWDLRILLSADSGSLVTRVTGGRTPPAGESLLTRKG